MKKVVGVGIGLILILSFGYFSRGNQADVQPQPLETNGAWVQPPTMFNPEFEKYTEVTVGSAVVLMVDNAEEWQVEISNSELLEFTPGQDMGSYEIYPGLTALAVGKTNVLATNNSGDRYEFEVLIRAKGEQLWGADPLAQEIAALVIGMTETEAIALIDQKSPQFEYRIVMRDGESFAVTMDYRINRINLEIDGKFVVNAYVG
jgi:hypothetical protein